MNEIIEELLLEIFSRCPKATLFQAQFVCHRWFKNAFRACLDLALVDTAGVFASDYNGPWSRFKYNMNITEDILKPISNRFTLAKVTTLDIRWIRSKTNPTSLARLPEDFLDTTAPSRALSDALPSLSKLIYQGSGLSLEHCTFKNLRHISAKIYGDSLPLARFPLLESLHLEFLQNNFPKSHWGQDAELFISSSFLSELYACANLTSLSITPMSKLPEKLSLGKFPKISSLCFELFDAEDLEQLSFLNEDTLQSLEVSYKLQRVVGLAAPFVRLTASDLVAQLVRFTSLRRLKISGYFGLSNSKSSFSKLTQLKHLEDITIEQVQVSSSLPHSPSLYNIDFLLPLQSNLKRLSLGKVGLNEKSLIIPNLSKFSLLESLSLDVLLEGIPASAISPMLLTLPKLSELHLNVDPMISRQFPSTLLQMTNMTRLHLSQVELDSTLVSAINNLGRLSYLSLGMSLRKLKTEELQTYYLQNLSNLKIFRFESISANKTAKDDYINVGRSIEVRRANYFTVEELRLFIGKVVSIDELYLTGIFHMHENISLRYIHHALPFITKIQIRTD